MHLVGVAKAGQNQHFRPFRVPVEKARRPAFGVTSNLLGYFRRDRGHASEGEAALAPDMDTARRLVANLETYATRLTTEGHPVVLLAPPDLRRPLFDFASRFVPDVAVVSARELVPGTTVEPAGTLGAQPHLAGAA